MEYPKYNIGVSGRLVIMNNKQMNLSNDFNKDVWTDHLDVISDKMNLIFYSKEGIKILIASSKSLIEAESFAHIYNNFLYSALTIDSLDYFFNVDLLRIFSREELDTFNHRSVKGN